MAQQMTSRLVDDLDGGKAAETVSFALDGVSYEIDLSARNAKALRRAFGEFTTAARQVKPSMPPISIAGQRRPRRRPPEGS
jgi:hypothetical protein